MIINFNNEVELRDRLLEYQKIKDMANDFRVLEERRSYVYTKLPSNLNEFREEAKLNTDITLNDLLNAFEEFLKRQKSKKPSVTTVTKKEFSVEERNILIKKSEENRKQGISLADDICRKFRREGKYFDELFYQWR